MRCKDGVLRFYKLQTETYLSFIVHHFVSRKVLNKHFLKRFDGNKIKAKKYLRINFCIIKFKSKTLIVTYIDSIFPSSQLCRFPMLQLNLMECSRCFEGIMPHIINDHKQRGVCFDVR